MMDPFTPQISYPEKRLTQFWEKLKIPYPLEPQYHTHGFWIDFVHLDSMTAIECDSQAYHSTPEQIARDQWRQEILEREGWYFVRVQARDILKNPVHVTYQIKRTIEQRLSE